MKITSLVIAFACFTVSASAAATGGKALKIWNEYREALKNDTAVLPLPGPSAFEKPVDMVWHLPDSLEPNADMTFSLLASGERPENGRPLYIYTHGSGVLLV